MHPQARIAFVRSSLLSLGLALAASVAAPSGAGAAAVPVTGRLTLAISTLPPITLTGTGVATVDGSGGGAHLGAVSLPANVFATVGRQIVITDLSAYPIMGIQLTAQNGSGAFGGSPLGGVMPLLGSAKICVFYDCAHSPPANISVPLSVVGAGGAAYAVGVVNVTVTGSPWTTGTAMAFGATASGFRHGPASGTSSTAAVSGRVRLVTPILIFTDLTPAANIPAFAVLDLHFVPEPGTLMLLGSGVVGLVAMGRRRRRA